MKNENIFISFSFFIFYFRRRTFLLKRNPRLVEIPINFPLRRARRPHSLGDQEYQSIS